MKLQLIQLLNLNSLYGEHVIDLENGLKGAPLFLISGPTGAGKSTLMDAVSLALFGKTPRLSGTRGAADTDPGHVMSRGSGEAKALVEFTKREGGTLRRYRATWHVRRSRGKSDGELQGVERGIERQEPDRSWTVLVRSKKINDYKTIFNDILDGMEVEDFQRSVLLAQGQFAAFLQAGEPERAAILERMTQTGQYRQIGALANLRRQASQAKLDAAHAALNAVSYLSAEAEEVLIDERRLAQLQAEEGRATAAQHRLHLDWQVRHTELSNAQVRASHLLAIAQSAVAEHHPDLARLAEHDRCAVAAGPLGELRSVRSQLAAQEGALPPLDQAERDAALLTAQATEALAQARSQADQATATLQESGAAIGQARELRSQKVQASKRLSKAREALAAAELTAHACTQGFSKSLELHSRAQGVAGQAQRDLQGLAHAEPLVQLVAGLSSRADAWQRGRLQLDQQRLAQVADSQALGEGSADLVRRATELRTLALAVSQQAQALADARASLTALLGESADARSRIQALHQGELAAADLIREAETAERLLTERSELQRSHAAGVAGLANLAEQIADTQARIHEAAQGSLRCEDQLSGVRTDLRSFEWALEVGRQRQHLQPGQECPLCGGQDHPYVRDGRHAEADRHLAERCAQLATQVAELQLEQKREAEQARMLATRLAERTTQQQHLNDEAGLAEAKWAQMAAPLTLALAHLRVPTDAPFEVALAEVHDQKSELEAKRNANRHLLQRVELAEAKAVGVDLEWRRCSDRAQTVAAQRDVEHAKQEARSAAWQQRARELADQQVLSDQDRMALAQALSSHGIAVAVDSDGADVLAGTAQAVHLAQAYREAEQTARAADGALTDAANHLTHASKDKDTAARELVAAAEGVAAEHKEWLLAAAAADQALGGQDPDQLEQQLLTKAKQQGAQHRTAEEAVEASRAASEEARRAHATAIAHATLLREQLAVLHRDVDNHLRSLGLEDEAALHASLLVPEHLQALRRHCRQLTDALTAANSLAEAEQQRTLQHALARPATLDPDLEAAAIERLLAEAHARIEQWVSLIANRTQQLDAQAQASVHRLILIDACRLAESEHAVWQRLHRLIGTQDGQAFQKFAQILNMEDLAAKANLHLARLAPRYALAAARDSDGMPRLDFAVCDAFQAGEPRPLTTLSGGETFLVSLALALALASFRAVRMPIETLLLDEGFGTLDQDTLQTAMNALGALHQAGVQVGIISHVEGLKDRIPARILLERVGNGRSTVRIDAGVADVA